MVELISSRDARRNPRSHFALDPAHRAGRELYAPREATFCLQLIDHRPTQSGNLADLLESQQAQWPVTRRKLHTHFRFPLGRADLCRLTLERRSVDVRCRKNLRGRHACRGQLRGRRPRVIAFGTLVDVRAALRAIQFITSDRRQPIGRPRNLRLFGNRRIRRNPAITQRGLRMSRATSCALRSSCSGG